MHLRNGLVGSAELLSDATLEWAYSIKNLVFYYARAQQIFENLRAGSTGQLSLVSSSLLLVGNMGARVSSLDSSPSRLAAQHTAMH